jgi:ABC transporter DrrB family efflux protein
VIEVEDVRRSFGPTEALAGVTLAAGPGEVLGLLGPNGAGKTTLIRLLATLLVADSGTVRVGGHDAAADPAAVRSLIGLAGQLAAVDGLLTGRENLDLIGRLYGLDRAERSRRAREVLEWIDLVDVADDRVQTYSGGMRRRLDLAATLVGRPAVLLLDEPTTGLDPRSRVEVWRHVEQLAADGTTVVLTSQQLDEVERLAHRIVLLDRGRVVAAGSADDLKRHVGGDVLEVRVTDEADLDLACRALVAAGDGPAQVDERLRQVTVPTGQGTTALVAAGRRLGGIALDDLGIRRPSLDDVFFRLTGTGTGTGTGSDGAAPAPGVEAATTTVAVAAPAVLEEPSEPPRPAPLLVERRHSGISDAAAITGRALRRLQRTPQLLFFALVQPMLFVATLAPVFGRLVERQTGVDYAQYLIPGVLVMTIALAAGGTGVALAEDLQTGVVDRFRSLPMARHALLVGRTLADLARNSAAMVLVVAVGLLLGFRCEQGLVRGAAALALVALFGFALSWMFAAVGLAVRDVQTAQFVGFAPVLPLVFLSGAWIPVEAMAGGLRPFARNQPVNVTLTAVRSLVDGRATAGSVLPAVLWSLAILAVFAPLAVRTYRRSASA